MKASQLGNSRPLTQLRKSNQLLSKRLSRLNFPSWWSGTPYFKTFTLRYYFVKVFAKSISATASPYQLSLLISRSGNILVPRARVTAFFCNSCHVQTALQSPSPNLTTPACCHTFCFTIAIFHPPIYPSSILRFIHNSHQSTAITKSIVSIHRDHTVLSSRPYNFAGNAALWLRARCSPIIVCILFFCFFFPKILRFQKQIFCTHAVAHTCRSKSIVFHWFTSTTPKRVIWDIYLAI